MRLRALLLVAMAGTLVAAAPSATEVLLPESRVAAAVEGPYTRATVRADGTIEQAGNTFPPAGPDIEIASLTESLRAARAEVPDAYLLVAGDRRADFRAVRSLLVSANAADIANLGFLAGPEASPPRVIQVSQRVGNFDLPADGAESGPSIPPLTVHLRADGVGIGRKVDSFVRAPHVGGALDLELLAHLLDEDKRLHPTARFVIINTDDGVPYADTFATLGVSREKGYPYTLLAGGPASAPPMALPTPPPLGARLEHFPRVTLRPDRGADFRASDGTVEIVRADDVTGYEAHCDTLACDLVLRTATRRLAIGERPIEAPLAPALFGRPLHTYAGRLDIAAVEREGALSPFVLLPGTDPTTVSEQGQTAAPILLGALDKKLIDAVIKHPANMGRVRECYNDLLKRDRSANGKITVKFIIAKDGTVSSASIKSSTFGDEAMHTCVTDTFRTFAFPEPLGGGIVIVSYPFVFSA